MKYKIEIDTQVNYISIISSWDIIFNTLLIEIPDAQIDILLKLTDSLYALI
ncbi:MAG: hypothetical protein ACRDE2_00220 [Chitinophagaceae bacterium]